MKTRIEFIPRGEMSRHVRVSKSGGNTRHFPRSVFVTYSQDINESFIEMFRKRATQDTRLLVFNEGASTDRLISHIVNLQIRTPQRFYVIDASLGSRETHHASFIRSLLKRLSFALEADDNQDRILDARIEDGVLRVVSPEFNRLGVPIARIPALGDQASSKIQSFEIDEDGSFIYWPKLDLHLGWAQLHQLVNPAEALKASQRSQSFNRRYGRAVQKVRELAGFKRSDIPGMSEKQLRRIENGKCRLTSHAIAALSQAHKLAPNDYMHKLAEALG